MILKIQNNKLLALNNIKNIQRLNNSWRYSLIKVNLFNEKFSMKYTIFFQIVKKC